MLFNKTLTNRDGKKKSAFGCSSILTCGKVLELHIRATAGSAVLLCRGSPQACRHPAVDHHGHPQQQEQLQTDGAETGHHLPGQGAHSVSEQAAQDQRDDHRQDARGM